MSVQTLERRTLRRNDAPTGAARPAAVRVLLDFDGTVTQVDTVDRLLGCFATAAWLDVEKDWEAGRIGSRACLEQQTALMRATPEALDALIETVPIVRCQITSEATSSAASSEEPPR